MSKDSTQRPPPDSNRGPFDPKSDAVTDWPQQLANWMEDLPAMRMRGEKTFNHRCKGGYILGKTPVSLGILAAPYMRQVPSKKKKKRQSNRE